MMDSYAEHTQIARRLLIQADQCERDKLYKAAAVELDEAIERLKLALAEVTKKIVR